MTVFLIIALIAFFVIGINTVIGKAKRAPSHIAAHSPFSRTTVTEPITTYPSPTKSASRAPQADLNGVFDYLGMLGWMDDVKDGPVAVHNPVLSEMLATLDDQQHLEWVLPSYGVGVYAVDAKDNRFPCDLLISEYTHVIDVGGRYVGFVRRQ